VNTEVTFMDCPAYMERHGTPRCGLPAAVEYRYTVSSAEGPVEGAKIRCPHGHWFNGPIEALTLEKYPSTAAPTAPRTGHQPGGRQEGNSTQTVADLAPSRQLNLQCGQQVIPSCTSGRLAAHPSCQICALTVAMQLLVIGVQNGGYGCGRAATLCGRLQERTCGERGRKDPRPGVWR
jgi:hypothetical protein